VLEAGKWKSNATVTTLKTLGKDETWLQDWFVEDPRRLGIGSVVIKAKELRHYSGKGGRLDNRNIHSSEISAGEDAMQKACSLMEQGHVVSHIAGPNGERIDIVDIRDWCAAHASR
jgi:hypothetical protein